MRLVVLVLLLSGCQAYPFMEIGAGYTIDGSPLLVGGDPTGHISAGFEFQWKGETQWVDRCEVKHWSHYFNGEPFNDDLESYSTEFACFVKVGGRPSAW